MDKIDVLGRDAVGESPVYYRWIGEDVIDSRDIRELIRPEDRINQMAMLQYLFHQYVPGEGTFYEDILKLPSGSRLVVDPDTGEDDVATWWEPREEVTKNFHVGAQSPLRYLLDNTVRSIVEGHDEVGVLLSGGLDSTIVVSLAKRHVKKLHTFCIGFEGFSEMEHARRVAEYLGSEHHEWVVTGDMVAERWPEVVQFYGEPVGDAATINIFLLAERAKDYVPLLLTGDGGDEVFGGYPWHKIARDWRLPFSLGRVVSPVGRMALSYLPGSGDPRTFGNMVDSMAGVFFEPSLWERQTFMEKALSLTEIRWLTGGSFSEGVLRGINSGIRIPQHCQSLLARVQALDIMNILPEKFCMKTNKASMAAGIPITSPFLDPAVIEFAFRLPTWCRLNGGVEKWILREAFAGYGPPENMLRKKQGFGTPVAEWFSQRKFGAIVTDTLDPYSNLAREYFDAGSVVTLQKMVKDGRFRNYHVANVVWTIFALMAWHEAAFCGG